MPSNLKPRFIARIDLSGSYLGKLASKLEYSY